MLSNIAFAAFLLCVAALLARHSQRSWQAVRDRDADPYERTFYVRRRWRRLGIAALIALVGLVIPLSTTITTVLVAEVYLIGLVAAVLLMFVVAIVDAFATQAFFKHERKRIDQARGKLEAELKRARERIKDDNGKAR